jgi:transcriptional regulator with XRE-family HTH domain
MYNHYCTYATIVQCLTLEGLAMPEADSSLGSRLRSLRKERDLSQRELADLAGLSPNAISLIERDEISPSVATLQRLAGALAVKMSYFFESATLAHVLHFRPNQRSIIRGTGLTIEGLGAHLDGQQIEPFFITLAAHADMGAGQVVHAGHEFVCCLAGRVQYEIDGVSYMLDPGDFLLFEANLPHRWGNPGDETAQLLLVLQAPDGVQEPARRHFFEYPSVTHLG